MVGIIEKVKDFEWQGLARVVRNGRVDHDEMDEEQGIASEGSLPPKKSTKRRTHQSFMTSEETEVRNNTIARGTQLFFLFISLFILIAIAAFQSSNDVGPSALTGIAFVPLIASIMTTSVLLAVPLVHDRTGKLKSINRNLSQIRFNFVVGLSTFGLLMLFAIIYSVSANVDGCKNADDDPNADKDGYKDKIGEHCRNKSALAAFFWFSTFAWAGSLVLTFLQWRNYRSGGASGQPFNPPDNSTSSGYDDAFDVPNDARDDDEEESYVIPPVMSQAPMQQPPAVSYGDSNYLGRQSGAYAGADRPFADPLPTGYGNPFGDAQQQQQVRPASQPYADPYDAIRQELEFDSDHRQPVQSGGLRYDR